MSSDRLSGVARVEMNRRNGGLSGNPVAGKKFLEYLQNFIKNELLVSKGKFKIGIYRQAFDYFIQEFKTYSSVLSDIKNEYELTIGELEERKRQLEPLKGKLEILKLQNLQELNAQTRDMDDFLEKFRWENQNLREQSLVFEEKLEMQKLEISNLLKENTLLKEKIKDSGIKITDHRSKEAGNTGIQEKDAEIERLQGLVAKANRKIADLSRDLQGLTENNDDFITPDKFHEEKKKVEEFQKKYSTSLGEITILEKKIQDLTVENEEYKKDSLLLESFKIPDWQYIQYQVAYSVREYEVGCKRMSCNDVIGYILSELLKVLKVVKDIRLKQTIK
jgi:DNA repair exonuclease SbcCD ATPase subunit